MSGIKRHYIIKKRTSTPSTTPSPQKNPRANIKLTQYQYFKDWEQGKDVCHYVTNARREEKETKGIQIGNVEIEQSLCAADMFILCRKYERMNKNFLELISADSKVLGQKVNMQTSITFSYASNEKVEIEIKNTLSFPLVLPPNKIIMNKHGICTGCISEML